MFQEDVGWREKGQEKKIEKFSKKEQEKRKREDFFFTQNDDRMK